MSGTLYDDTHVTLCRMLGRRYNNPLEDRPWPLLERLLGRGRPRVLDLGCGRGASSLAWARRGARVTGVDPSEAMITEARRLARQEEDGLDVSFRTGRLDQPDLSGSFDLVLLHDVLCYLPDREEALGRALGHLRSGGILSVTDYHGSAGLETVDRVARAWGIGTPWTFLQWEQALEASGARSLLVVDTTRRYRDHWAGLLTRLEDRREALEDSVGADAVEAFSDQVKAILAAVDSGAFGHLWAVLEAS